MMNYWVYFFATVAFLYATLKLVSYYQQRRRRAAEEAEDAFQGPPPPRRMPPIYPTNRVFIVENEFCIIDQPTTRHLMEAPPSYEEISADFVAPPPNYEPPPTYSQVRQEQQNTNR